VGARGSAVCWGTALQIGRSRVRFPMVSLEFFIDIILPAALLAPGVDSASNRNEYQEYFLWGKGGRCVGLTTLPSSCADFLEIWEPQPPGTLKACPRPVIGLLDLFTSIMYSLLPTYDYKSSCTMYIVIDIYLTCSISRWPIWCLLQITRARINK
jgi:hypothetical protein